MIRLGLALAAGLIAVASVPASAEACGARPREASAQARRAGCVRAPVTTARLRLAVTSIQRVNATPNSTGSLQAARLPRCRIEAQVVSVERLHGTRPGPRISALTICPATGAEVPVWAFGPEGLRPGGEIIADFVQLGRDPIGRLQRSVEPAAPQTAEVRS